ncbi:hypothetical protein [Bacillus dakarensis]|uniref:hypothetical protein n=1 Tax=Robertmurraya dakarensis TaxID=1926278 RepID=UPI0011155781|nr:hypothetical protein [Bacillus dakarensis]
MENYFEEKENSSIVIEDKEIINSLVKIINRAKQKQGQIGRDPDYKIEIGKETYLLWLEEKVVVMAKEKDSRTFFSFSNSAIKQINEMVQQIEE